MLTLAHGLLDCVLVRVNYQSTVIQYSLCRDGPKKMVAHTFQLQWRAEISANIYK